LVSTGLRSAPNWIIFCGRSSRPLTARCNGCCSAPTGCAGISMGSGSVPIFLPAPLSGQEIPRGRTRSMIAILAHAISISSPPVLMSVSMESKPLAPQN